MKKNYWHPAFCGATEWELKQNKDDLLPEDLQNIDAVLQVSVSANKDLYEEVRRDEEMCQDIQTFGYLGTYVYYKYKRELKP